MAHHPPNTEASNSHRSLRAAFCGDYRYASAAGSGTRLRLELVRLLIRFNRANGRLCQEAHFLLSKHNDDIMQLIAYYYAGINVDFSLLPSTPIKLAQIFRQGLLMTSHIAPEVLTLERHLLRQALERPKFW